MTNSGESLEEPLLLDDHVRDILLEEIPPFQEQLPSSELKQAYQTLLDQVREQKAVSGDAVAPLERLLAVGLETGRFKHVYGPHPEQSARKLYHQTPRGAAVKASVAKVNTALQSIEGHELDELTFRPKGPGSYSLVIDTDRCRVRLELTPGGVILRNLEMTVS